MSPGDFPVIYRASKNAWMTADLFTEWFHKYFVPKTKKFLLDQNLPPKAFLYVDNCTAHPENNTLISGDIVVKFLPPNTTSILQPMDQGILRQLKVIYKSRLMLDLVADDDKSIIQAWKDYNIRDAIFNIASAWDNIKPENHQKAWRKLMPGNEIIDFDGFKPLGKENKEAEDMLKRFLQGQKNTEQISEEDFREWIDADKTLTAYEVKDDYQILDDVLHPENTLPDETDEAECEPEKAEVSLAETAECLRKAISSLSFRGLGTTNEYLTLNRIKDKVQKA
ncbi:unnamed protein product, partial [Meganyctiphanes norvegica]